MKEVLISFNTAKLAKEKGFRYKSNKAYSDTKKPFPYLMDCENYYDFNSYTDKNRDGWAEGFGTMFVVVRQSLLQKWLRDEFKIHIEIKRDEDYWKPELCSFYGGNKHIPTGFKNFLTYEEALEEGLEKGLNLI